MWQNKIAISKYFTEFLLRGKYHSLAYIKISFSHNTVGICSHGAGFKTDKKCHESLWQKLQHGNNKIGIFLEPTTHLEDGYQRPQNVVEVLAIALALWVLGHDFGTSTFSLLPLVIHKLTELTAKQIHAKYATNLRVSGLMEVYWFLLYKT